MKIIKDYPVASFFLLTIGLAWILWVPLLIFEGYLQLTTIVIVIGGFSPFISAILIKLISSGKEDLKLWLKTIFMIKVNKTAYLFAFVYPILYSAASYGLYLLFGGTPADFSQTPPLLLYPIGVIFVFFLGGGQEEPGWRGFALKELLNSYSPFLSSVLIGIIWGIWHLPLFFVEGSSQAGIPFEWYLPNTIGMAMIFTMIYMKSSKSVIPSMVLHGGLNTAIAWFPMTESVLPSYAYITIVGWIVVLCFLIFFQRNEFFKRIEI